MRLVRMTDVTDEKWTHAVQYDMTDTSVMTDVTDVTDVMTDEIWTCPKSRPSTDAGFPFSYVIPLFLSSREVFPYCGGGFPSFLHCCLHLILPVQTPPIGLITPQFTVINMLNNNSNTNNNTCNIIVMITTIIYYLRIVYLRRNGFVCFVYLLRNGCSSTRV